MHKSVVGPWPDVATARAFLAFLAGLQAEANLHANKRIDEEKVANWLIFQGLGPLAYFRCQEQYPQLARFLQEDIFSSTAESSLHWHNLEQVSTQFSKAGIPITLLKGAALAETVYGERERRPMTDVDIWLRKHDIERSCAIMHDLGFSYREKADRPRALEIMSNGEIQFFRKGWQQSLVELHLSPFAGWWLQRTAVIDSEGIWSRTEPLVGREFTYQLSAEDMVIHIAVHLAVNHQCGLSAVRSLMDIALTAQARPLNWGIVGNRAKQWRVGTAVWLVLSLLQQLVGTPGLDKIVNQLRPPQWRRKFLHQLISPESILLGFNLTGGRIRFLYLLLLVDRKQDMIRLVYRTLWPEREWLIARYGQPRNHWQHLEQFIRHGQT